MPTPFYHIRTALDLLGHQALNQGIRQYLEQMRCPFILGNTAPDVQVVSGDTREATHFFLLPFQNNAPTAWDIFLTTYPTLALSDQLPRDQAAFLAGYLCHLQADYLWVKEIFAPIFGPTCNWGTFRERLYLHNVLRAYLDHRVIEELPPGIDACLIQATPRQWLPFVNDKDLEDWRNYLTRQLQPGALAETVEVFAERQGIDPEEYHRILRSEERMAQEVFIHVPRRTLEDFRKRLLIENIKLLENYLVRLASW